LVSLLEVPFFGFPGWRSAFYFYGFHVSFPVGIAFLGFPVGIAFLGFPVGIAFLGFQLAQRGVDIPSAGDVRKVPSRKLGPFLLVQRFR